MESLVGNENVFDSFENLKYNRVENYSEEINFKLLNEISLVLIF